MGRKKKRVYPPREETRTTLSFPKEYNETIKEFCSRSGMSRVDFVKLAIDKICGYPIKTQSIESQISYVVEGIKNINKSTSQTLDFEASLMAEIATIKERISSIDNSAPPLPNPVADTTNLIKVPALKNLKTRIAAGHPLTPAERLYCIANLICPQCGNPLREKSTFDGQKFIGCETKNAAGRFSCCTFSGDVNLWVSLREIFKEEEQ